MLNARSYCLKRARNVRKKCVFIFFMNSDACCLTLIFSHVDHDTSGASELLRVTDPAL